MSRQRADCPSACPTEDRVHQGHTRNPPTCCPVLPPTHVDRTRARQGDGPRPPCAQQQCCRSSKRHLIFRDKRHASLPHVERQCAAHPLVSRSEPAWAADLRLVYCDLAPEPHSV